MGEFVGIKSGDREIRNLEYESAIFGADSEIVCEVEVHSASINKCGFRLAGGSVDYKSVGWIKDQGTGAAKSVRPNLRNSNRQMHFERARQFVKIGSYG